MNKALNLKKLMIVSFSAVSLSAAISIVPANGAVLSGIEINSLNNNSYQITIKADEKVPIEKTAVNNNKLILDLGEVKPSRYINTVYNNAPGVDHVIVQPISDSKVRVFIEGANISSSQINVDTNLVSNMSLQEPPIPVQQDAKQQTVDSQQEVVYLNKPIDSFKPATVNYENEESAQTVEETVNKTVISGAAIKNLFNKRNFDWLLRLGVLGLLLIAGFKLLAPTKRKNVEINLSNNTDLKDREIDLFKSLHNKRGLVGSGLGSIPKKPVNNSVAKYGIKEYQNSQLPNLGRNFSMPTEEKPRGTILKNKSVLNSSIATKQVKPFKDSGKTTSKDINTAKINADNMKFLESMARIYEKSGRVDLARGLQSNILKAREQQS